MVFMYGISLQRNDGILLLAGGEVHGQSDDWARFAVILYDNTRSQFVFSARQYAT